VIFLEHKGLYRRVKEDLPEEEYTVPIGKARVFRPGNHLSIITYGAMVYMANDAADQLAKEGISVEIVDLRTVLPSTRRRCSRACARLPRPSSCTRTS